MPESVESLRAAIAALEAQRDALGDAVLRVVLDPLHERLKLLLDAPPMQQLRRVSVLFIDVVGSSTLGQHLDPEDIHGVMDSALSSFTRIVQARGGVVLQYAGDSLLAVFGTPTSGEDDAERAVRSALSILDEARDLADAVLRKYGHAGFAVRAGIASGPVLLGGGVDGEHSIRGSTVNLAARMEQAAPPGRLRICSDTRALVRGLFTLDEQAPLLVKGFDQPQATWLVGTLAGDQPGRVERGVAGVSTPLVGRGAELAALQQIWQDWSAAAPRRPVLVLLVGDAGLGKSRLAGELKRWTQAQRRAATWLHAFAGEREQGRPYGLLRQIFMRCFGILDSDPPALARARWLGAHSTLLHDAGDAAVLGQLLGLDFADHAEVLPLASEGRQLRDRAFFHACQALRRLAAGASGASGAPGTSGSSGAPGAMPDPGGGEPPAPLAILLDDLHWADAGSVDFIRYVQQQATDLPLLLLATARPQFDERLAQGPQGLTTRNPHRIDLQALAPGDADVLAEALLHRLGHVPASLRERLTRGAEGNPFYMEELVNMLVDRGVLVVDGGAADLSAPAVQAWQFHPERLDRASLPTTLAGVLQARLDNLPGAQSHALQLAAVVGHTFWDDTLRVLGLDDATALLHQLAQRQLIVEREASSLQGRREYAFRHHLLHEVCYERVLKRVRIPAHAQVARWLESLPGDPPFDLVAEHYERGDESARALDAWQRAAAQALANFANTQALAHCARALALLPGDDAARRFDLMLLRARVLDHLRDEPALVRALQDLDGLADLLDNNARRSQAADRRARFHFARGEADVALRHAERAAELAAPDSPELALSASQTMVGCLLMLGDTPSAEAVAREGLERARHIGDRRMQGVMLNSLGVAADDHGDISGSVEWYSLALQCHRDTGNIGYAADVLSNLGYAELGLGNYDTACATFEQARDNFQRFGQRTKVGVVQINLALATLNMGRTEAAIVQADLALQALAGTGSLWAEAAALRVRGLAHLELAQHEQACADLSLAAKHYDTLKLSHLATEARASLALAQWRSGDTHAALTLARKVHTDIADSSGISSAEEPLRVYLDCWQVLQLGGATSEAGKLLQRGHELLLQRLAHLPQAEQRERTATAVPHFRRLREAWALHGSGHTTASLKSVNPY